MMVLVPPLISQGPSLPEPQQREVQDFDTDLFGECAEILMSHIDMHEKHNALRTMVQRKTLSWTSFWSHPCQIP